MKHFFWIPLAFLLMPTFNHAQTAEEVLKKVHELSKQGNHREAADLGKKALLTEAGTAELLAATNLALGNLNAAPEQEEVIEAAVKAHPKKWPLLLMAGVSYQGLPHQGAIVDGKFERGQYNYRSGGRYVETNLRDRVRALQLMESAWKNLPDDATAMMKEQVLDTLSHALTSSRYGAVQAWSLQHLTDLGTLPDYDDQSGLDDPATGYPVDAEGNPIYFQAPADWDAARSDGERLMFIRQNLSTLSASVAEEVKLHQAALAKQWFSVQTLAGYGFRFEADENESAKRDGIATLHTLKDEETVARLATGRGQHVDVVAKGSRLR